MSTVSCTSRRFQIRAALLIGSAAAAATYALLRVGGPGLYASDFTYAWVGARAIATGSDPYRAVLTGAVPWSRFMLYPAPAFLVSLPFAWLPVQLAGALFVGVGAGFLAFFAARQGAWRLTLFMSAPMIQACASVQWSPLLTACALYAPALGLLAAKPNLAIPLIGMQRNARAYVFAVIGGAILLIAGFVISPHWVSGWLSAIHAASAPGRYATPIGSLFGFPLVLAALRWRRPEARLLLLMACVPQKILFYDQLPLLLIPCSRREMTLAVGCSLVAYLYALQFPWLGVRADVVTANILPAVVVGLYWPGVWMVLRRANEGPAPPWLERRLNGLPPWLRGATAAA
jgi:hypothetical protein